MFIVPSSRFTLRSVKFLVAIVTVICLEYGRGKCDFVELLRYGYIVSCDAQIAADDASRIASRWRDRAARISPRQRLPVCVFIILREQKKEKPTNV